nr:unnamed protein product [Spirometra erinaceieuropaei]
MAKPQDTALVRFYGLPKVHKDGAPLRPIVSLKGTPTYGLAKWLFRRLKILTAESDTTVSSSAQFLEKHKGDVAGALFGEAVFAKIGLVRAFHQIPVAPEYIPKTAVTTPFGLSEFIRMLFGLRNAAQTLQSLIDHVLRGLPPVYAYIVDLLVASRNEEEHKEHLTLVLDRLDKFGVVINPSKCVLGVPSLEFLGHQVDSEGLRTLPSKVDAVRTFPPPTSKRQLQRFLGMVHFYRRFLPNCADLMRPLTNMLSGPKGSLELTVEALTALERIENSLADANLLTHPAPEAQLSLMVDASTVALLPAETRYSTIGRELLAIYLAMKHFRHLLEGRDFTFVTDHKPLTFALRSHSDKCNPREIAHQNYISQFTTDIRHIDGMNNEVADMLSRPSLSSLQLAHGIDLCAMEVEQQRVGCPGVESAEAIVEAFLSRWVAMFGAPSMVTTDRSAQIELALFQTLLNFLGCRRIRTTAYSPATNGMVERFHRKLKTALRAVEDPGNWSDNLPLAVLGIHAALKSDLGCSAAELVFGTTFRLRFHLELQ